MRVAYEHIRLVPEGRLAEELQKAILEAILAENTTAVPHVDSSAASNGDEKDPHDQAAREMIIFEVFGPETSEDDNAVQSSTRSLFFANTAVGDPSRDIGQMTAQGPQENEVSLHSGEQKVLKQIHDVLGNTRVTHRKLDFAPP